MSGRYPSGRSMQLGLKPLPSQVVEVVEFDNHSPLREGVWGRELGGPCLTGRGGGILTKASVSSDMQRHY